MNKVQNNELASLGVILKLKSNRVIVMTEKLDFVELNLKPGMIRGQKVSFTSSDLYTSNFWSSRYSNVLKTVSAVASIAAVFAFLFIGYKALFSTNEFAYVDIDINPSVEMAIDKNENVIKAEALNSDGQVLLDKVKLKNTDLSDAVTLLLDKSKEIGFIRTNNNKVILSTSINSNNVSDSDIEKIDTMVSSLKEIADKSGVDSEIVKLSPEDRKEALETGLSMGKYYIYNKAKYEGISLDVEDVKNASVESLLSKIAVKDTDNIPPENQATTESTAPVITPTPAVASNENDNNNPSRTASTAYTPALFSAYATPTAMFGPTLTLTPKSTPAATDLAKATTSIASSNITTPAISTSPIHTTVPTYTHSPSSEPIIPAAPSLKPTDKVSVKLSMFNEIKSSQTKEVQPRFKLTNNGNTPIDLSKIKIRYYYTIDIDGKYQDCYCDWSNIGTNHITKKLVKMSSNEENADHYLEVGFTNTDSLEPGDSVELVCRFGPDYEVGAENEVYNQLNDYSFNGTTNNFVSWNNATVYFSDSLIWGSEP